MRVKNLLKSYLFTKSFTPSRFLNLLSVYLQFKILKNSHVFGYPIKLIIDPTNKCILKCRLCPTGQNRRNRAQGMMSFEDFKKAIGELGKYAYKIDLFSWGEPFLNKDIFQMIRYVHERKIFTTISSNLNYFNEKMAEELVKSGLDHLIVSLDGTNQRTYEKYQVGGNFQKVIHNLKWIVKKKKELKSKTPFLQWRFLVMKQNEAEIPKAKQVAKELGVDYLELAQVRCDMGKELYLNDKEKIEQTMKWLPVNEKYSRYDYKKKQRKIKHKNCLFLWTQTSINWDLTMAPCCAVYAAKDDFGSLKKESFKQIWNNKKYVAARQMMGWRKKIDSSLFCHNCFKNGILD